MPCHEHEHTPWPTGGHHDLIIESCETRCGWCKYQISSRACANNLRAHAKRHVGNPEDETLRNINVVRGKVGRSRLRVIKCRRPMSENELALSQGGIINYDASENSNRLLPQEPWKDLTLSVTGWEATPPLNLQSPSGSMHNTKPFEMPSSEDFETFINWDLAALPEQSELQIEDEDNDDEEQQKDHKEYSQRVKNFLDRIENTVVQLMVQLSTMTADTEFLLDKYTVPSHPSHPSQNEQASLKPSAMSASSSLSGERKAL